MNKHTLELDNSELLLLVTCINISQDAFVAVKKVYNVSKFAYLEDNMESLRLKLLMQIDDKQSEPS